MSFRTALSGINAATTDLSVTSNNIANVSTAGFKEGRADFGDLYAASIFGTSRNTAGSGVRVTGITQQFTQGSIEFTNRNLDVAISGGGFFTLNNNGATVYSRAGECASERLQGSRLAQCDFLEPSCRQIAPDCAGSGADSKHGREDRAGARLSAPGERTTAPEGPPSPLR